MDRATTSGTFAAARLVTALLLVSWNTNPPAFRPAANPAALQARAHSVRKVPSLLVAATVSGFVWGPLYCWFVWGFVRGCA
jgi:hypothetical protein